MKLKFQISVLFLALVYFWNVVTFYISRKNKSIEQHIGIRPVQHIAHVKPACRLASRQVNTVRNLGTIIVSPICD